MPFRSSLHRSTAFSPSRAARASTLAARGRLRPLTAALRRAGDGSGQFRPCNRRTVMHDKSHVSLEQHVCLVCGTAFDTGAILLDKRLRASMERHTKTGWGLREEEHTSELQSPIRIPYAGF